jgi:hypothetical protein
LDVSGSIVRDAPEFTLDAGRHGILQIRYGSILDLIYGPAPLPLDRNPRLSQGRYPWSAGIHRANSHYLKIRFRDEAGATQVVMLGLSRDIERPTLDLLQERTGRAIDFETVEACLRGRPRDACGYGEVAELKDRATVFVHSSSVHESMRTENHRRIVATIVESGVPLRIVDGPDEADIILAFRYLGGGSPVCTEAIGYGPDRGVAEVYVTHSSGPRVVLVFDEECRIWKRWLADSFAKAFIRAYKAANTIK